MKKLLAMSRRSMFAAAVGILLGAASSSTASAQSTEPSAESILPRWVATWVPDDRDPGLAWLSFR